MLFESLIHSAFFVIYGYLSLYVLRKNPKDRLNQSIAAMMFVSALQSLSIMAITYPTVDISTANSFMDVWAITTSATGITAFLSLVYYTRFFKPGVITYTILLSYLVGLTVYQFATDFAHVSEKNLSGQWIPTFSNDHMLTALDIIHNTLLISGFALLITYFIKQSDYIRKRQSRLILIMGIISYALSFASVIYASVSGENRFSMFSDVFMSIFLVGFIYSIIKYELFEITPSLVAEEIIEYLPIGLIIADAQHNIVRINDALCDVTQKKEKFFYKGNLKKVLNKLTNQKFDEKIQTDHDFFHLEITVGDSGNKSVNIYHKQLVDSYDRNFGSITLIHDIDQLIKTQKLLNEKNLGLEEKVALRTKELSVAKEKAEESSRLKTEFINNLSHEIRTPLNGILGFSRLLNNPGLTADKRKEFSDIVLSNGNQLAKIIDDILEISALRTLKSEVHESAFSLNDLLMELFSFYNIQAIDRNLQMSLKKTLHDTESDIISDKVRIERILKSLIENALKFTEKGHIEIGYYLSQDNILLYVKDTGPGISHSSREIIFDHFSQGKREKTDIQTGLGLGLSIAKKYAQLLEGDIIVESEPDKGSTFFVRIPYKPDK